MILKTRAKKINIEPAPMAGFTDRAFRRVLSKCGAKQTWTEMISATALFYNNKKTIEMLESDKRTVVQLFGKSPEHFMHACTTGMLDRFSEININMGCPAPKIVKNGEGVALMKRPELARSIIAACVKSTKKPVSVKFRLGYSAKENNSIEFARMCEQAGAARIIVHGRFGEQGYSGVADWNTLAEIVRAVKIPVIANGDIKDINSIQKCLEVTGAEGVMMGRALLGAPWKLNPKFKATERNIKKVIDYHIDQSRRLHGDGSILEMRKHLLYYCNYLSGGKELKKSISICSSFDEARRILGL